MVFLDSDHQIDRIVKDIDALYDKLKIGGKIFVHDITYGEEMGKLLKDYFDNWNHVGLAHCGVTIKGNREWSYKEDLRGPCGMGIATKLRGIL